MFCANCGNNLPANAAFCSQCGSATLSANTPTPTQTYQTPPPNYQQPNYPPPSSQGIGYFDVLKKYCVFRGRARRKEFWWFWLIQLIILALLGLLLVPLTYTAITVMQGFLSTLEFERIQELEKELKELEQVTENAEEREQITERIAEHRERAAEDVAEAKKCGFEYSGDDGDIPAEVYLQFANDNNAKVQSNLQVCNILSFVLIAIIVIFALATLLPNLGVCVRRLHDTGRSGWWYLLCVIPYLGAIGAIVLLVFYCLDSEKGTNKYGPNPKGS
ncbi:MAG: DUF805 domain-containing protein [Planctomycetaceae bacterium]|jgi:uncharacterized membrane protein YhaH (DUF805 family)|nr:DUF805 domain-containing protein [Planctomycetaceae bacterium]